MRGRLWRLSDPALSPDTRAELVDALMRARRAVRDARDGSEALRQARAAVDAAKRGLGERGPPWWTDGAPDYNRRLVANTPYAAWHAALNSAGAEGGAEPDTPQSRVGSLAEP